MPTIYELFRENAERWPDLVVVEMHRRTGMESCTHAELRRMAESVGRWLRERGLERGARVAILADNHPRWVDAYMGILAAGGAAVPLDASYNAVQIASLL